MQQPKFTPIHHQTHQDPRHDPRKMLPPGFMPGVIPQSPGPFNSGTMPTTPFSGHNNQQGNAGNSEFSGFPGVQNYPFPSSGAMYPQANSLYAAKPSYELNGSSSNAPISISNIGTTHSYTSDQAELVHYLKECIEAQRLQMTELQNQLQQLVQRIKEAESKPSYTIEKLEYHFDQLKVEKLDGTLNIGMTPPSAEQFDEFGQLSLPQKAAQAGASVYPINPKNPYPAAGQPPVMPIGPAPMMLPNATAQAAPGSPGPLNPLNPNGRRAAADAPPVPIHMHSPNVLEQAMQRTENYMSTEAPAVLERIAKELNVSMDEHHRLLVLADIRRQLPTRMQHYLQHHQSISGETTSGSKQLSPQMIENDAVRCTIRDAELAMRQYLTNVASFQSSPEGEQ